MQLKTFVKVGSINNLSDARYCAGMGVNMLGYCLDSDSPDYINPESFKEITEWLEGPLNIAEFNDSNTEAILKAINQYQLDGIQVDTKIDITNLEYNGLKILKIAYSDSLSIINELITNNPAFDYYLIDSDQKITLKDTALESLNKLSQNGKILLGVGVSPNNIQSLIDNSNIGGIHLKGSDEERPGFSNLDDLADILEILEVEV